MKVYFTELNVELIGYVNLEDKLLMKDAGKY